MDVFSLTYVSSASGLYSCDIYRDIALTAHKYNSDHDITGMLLVFNETIIQFLEGPEAEIEDLYKKIENDPRHKGPIVVSTRHLTTREFPQWSMGYKELLETDDPKFIFSLDPETLNNHFPVHISGTTDALLNSFKRSSGLITA